MTDAIRTARYDGQQTRRILADLTHLEQLASSDPRWGAHGWDAVVTAPDVG